MGDELCPNASSDSSADGLCPNASPDSSASASDNNDWRWYADSGSTYLRNRGLWSTYHDLRLGLMSITYANTLAGTRLHKGVDSSHLRVMESIAASVHNTLNKHTYNHICMDASSEV